MTPKLDTEVRYRMGTLLDDPGEDVFLYPNDLRVHACILGGSGSGKSKFLERLGRCMLEAGEGFCYVDPHGDTVEDLMAYADWKRRVKGDDELWRRLHYLEPSFEMVFGYDPFKFDPLHAAARSAAAYEAWLHTKVDAVSEILQGKQGQMGFEGMPRLQRVLRDLLYAVGRAVDPKRRRHLPLSDALILLDPYHPRHDEVYRLVEPFLGSDVRADFRRWRTLAAGGARGADAILRETESTLNRLRSFFGPVVKGIFCDTLNTIDFYSIIQSGGVILLNLRETDYFSADQGNAIGGLFIHEVITTMARTPRWLRKPFTLVVDEAGEHLSPTLLRALGTVRKYMTRLVLAGQDMTTFVKGELDMGRKVLSQCGTLVCFQQQLEEDLKILADRLCRGDLGFEELYQVMDRPDGHEFLEMEDYSEAFTWSDNWSEGGSFNSSETVSETRSRQRALQRTWSEGHSHQESLTTTEGTADTSQESTGAGRGETPLIDNAMVQSMIPTSSRNDSESKGLQETRSSSLAVADAVQKSRGGGVTDTEGDADGLSSTNGSGVNFGRGGATGGSSTVSRRTQVLPRTREEWHPTGKLRRSIPDQFEWKKTVLYGLDVAEAVMKTRSRKTSLAMRVAEVREVWEEENKYAAIEKLKAELYALRPYFYPPPAGPDAERERLDRFLYGGVGPDEVVGDDDHAAGGADHDGADHDHDDGDGGSGFGF